MRKYLIEGIMFSNCELEIAVYCGANQWFEKGQTDHLSLKGVSSLDIADQYKKSTQIY